MTKNKINHILEYLPKLIGEAFCQLLLLLTAAGTIIPNFDKMPKVGLDPSWNFTLNQAIAQGFIFGRDLIFTFGPYAPLYTNLYHPEIDLSLYFACAAYLAVSYWVCLAIMIHKGNWRWYVGVSAFVCFFMIFAKDELLFSYPLIACLACHRLPFVFSGKTKFSFLIIFIIFSGFGLVTLVKGSILPLYFLLALLICIFFLYYKMTGLAILSLVSFFSSMAAFWVAAGQRLSSLAYFISSMSSIISGYSEAMSSYGPFLHVIWYIATYAILLCLFCRNTDIHISDKLFITLICLLIGFFAFKAAFVRHDGHALTAGNTLCFVAAGLAAVFRPRNFFIVFLLCASLWLGIDGEYRNTSSSAVKAKIHQVFINQPKSILKWFFRRSAQKKIFDAAFYATLQDIQKELDFPVLPGTSDIYSYNQTDLLASGNIYNPRPVFQSYSAYTPALLLANLAHLLSPTGPDNIFFRLETIDHRLPSLDDGVSWRVLLSKYGFERLLAPNTALLRKLGTSSASPPPARSVPQSRRTYSLGENIPVHRSTRPLFVSITIKPTLLGELASLLYKRAHLWLQIRLVDGSERRFRFIAGMGETGFLISPIVESTEEFTYLYTDRAKLLTTKAVASISLTTEGFMCNWQWRNTYEILFDEEIGQDTAE